MVEAGGYFGVVYDQAHCIVIYTLLHLQQVGKKNKKKQLKFLSEGTCL